MAEKINSREEHGGELASSDPEYMWGFIALFAEQALWRASVDLIGADMKAAKAFNLLGREELGMKWMPYPEKVRTWRSQVCGPDIGVSGGR